MTALEGMLGMMEIHTVDGVHWKRGESVCLFVCSLFSLFAVLVHFLDFLSVCIIYTL